MILVLAEKPSVGKDIGKVLNCSKSGNGFVEGNKYIVTWALGHLVTLADPESYNPKYNPLGNGRPSYNSTGNED